MGRIKVERKFSRGLTVIVILLVVFGVAMVWSAGAVEGERKFGSSSHFVIHQLLHGILPGLILFFILSRIPFKVWRPFALLILASAILLLVMIFIPDFGFGLRGATRWLSIGPITFQPSEFLKLALIIYLAAWFQSREKHMEKGKSGWVAYVPLIVILGSITVLLLKQPDLGTLGIIIMIAGVMYFFAGARFKHLVIVSTIGLVLLSVFAVAEPYRFDRVKTFFNPEEDLQGKSYHINQALISIGSGGLFGLGYGQSRQKLGLLPEPMGDSVFAIIMEELGFVGGATLILLYLLLVYFMIRIAKKSENTFGRLFVLGMTVWIIGQAYVNIAAISNIIPLTGVPLPLISYGSSSMLTLLAGLGIVRNISKGAG